MEQVVIRLEAEIEAFVEEWLWAQGALSVSTLPADEPERRLDVLFKEIDEELFRLSLDEALAHLPVASPELAFATIPDQEWQVSWRENFKPLAVGGFRLVGEWEQLEPDDRTLLIYPGQAFGTGQHETTRLMIERLCELKPEGCRVLDIGCGSGILSIVAERLGAVAVLGFDADPDCAENMAHHLAINRTSRTRLVIGHLADIEAEPYDLVLANITINVLQEIWPALAPYLAAGGIILNSGILVEQRDEALHALARNGFKAGLMRAAGQWLLIEATRL